MLMRTIKDSDVIDRDMNHLQPSNFRAVHSFEMRYDTPVHSKAGHMHQDYNPVLSKEVKSY